MFNLFRSHCSSFYGCELWASSEINKKYVNSFSVSFHNAIKKIFNLPRSESNHYICNSLNTYTFFHLLNKMYINFAFNMLKSESICLSPFLTYFKYSSLYMGRIKAIFLKHYNLNNLLENDNIGYFCTYFICTIKRRMFPSIISKTLTYVFGLLLCDFYLYMHASTSWRYYITLCCNLVF